MEYCLEIAQSHDGSVGYVHGLLESLKKREIKLVKFQMHFPEYESTDLEVFRSNFSVVDKSRFDYWKRTSFTPKEWRTIFDKCSELNIEFLCTPLSKFAVEILEDLGITAQTIARQIVGWFSGTTTQEVMQHRASGNADRTQNR